MPTVKSKTPPQLEILLHCIALEREAGVPEVTLHEKYGQAMCNTCCKFDSRSSMPILDTARLQVAKKMITELRKKL